ncbi:hypothetical protein CB1_000249009 [Camelus ferus]|nr:hypothetical protein CB1_000249009 [Camelus ferus]
MLSAVAGPGPGSSALPDLLLPLTFCWETWALAFVCSGVSFVVLPQGLVHVIWWGCLAASFPEGFSSSRSRWLPADEVGGTGYLHMDLSPKNKSILPTTAKQPPSTSDVEAMEDERQLMSCQAETPGAGVRISCLRVGPSSEVHKSVRTGRVCYAGGCGRLVEGGPAQVVGLTLVAAVVVLLNM